MEKRALPDHFREPFRKTQVIREKESGIKNSTLKSEFRKMTTSLLQTSNHLTHSAGFWSSESGYNLRISFPKEPHFCPDLPTDLCQLFPKNSGWIKKTYQRISPFGKSGPSEPVSGVFPQKCMSPQSRNSTSEKTTLNDHSIR